MVKVDLSGAAGFWGEGPDFTPAGAMFFCAPA